MGGGGNSILKVRKNETQRDSVIYIPYHCGEGGFNPRQPDYLSALFNLTEHCYLFSGKLSYTLALWHVPVSP